MSEQSYSEPESATAPPVADDGRAASPGTGSSDGLPGWAPWAVLGALLSFGLLGGLGLVPLRMGLASSAAATAEAASPSFTTKGSPSAAKVSPSAAPAASAEQWYSAIYLVVSHKDTKLGARHNITRTREEARQRADAALVRARKGEDFAKLVQELSDDPTLPQLHGVLKSFRYKDAVKPFADAVVAIKPGELSGVVETPFGFHVIKRLEYQAPSAGASAAPQR